jgi:hypothetical protein
VLSMSSSDRACSLFRREWVGRFNYVIV